MVPPERTTKRKNQNQKQKQKTLNWELHALGQIHV